MRAAARGSMAPICALALVCALSPASPAAPPTAAPARMEAGAVRFAQEAGSSFDRFTRSPSPATRAFIQTRYARMKAFSPYFDRRTAFFPRAWAYLDLYGIERGSRIARRHPDWILRSRRGKRLYVPFECSSGRCLRWAGDITNASFRRWWIRRARQTVKRGYIGIYIDNVNMIRRVGNGAQVEVTPYRARSRKPISRSAWRRYVARYTRQIRRALPAPEIVHNVIWFARRPRDRWGRMQVASADIIGLERGVNDAGLTGDNGRFGLPTFLGFVDWIHGRGRAVMFDEEVPSVAAREYGLAGYMLINEGFDLFSSLPYSRPDNWWRGYQVAMGAPKGRRYSWRGLIRRDFDRGVVLLNLPGRALQRVDLGGRWSDAAGGPRSSSVTLGPAAGAVLLRR